MLLEQFGGANGELAAAMQYSIQELNCDDPRDVAPQVDIELSRLIDEERLDPARRCSSRAF